MSRLQTWQWYMRPWGTCVLRMAKHLTLTFTVGAQGQSWSWKNKMPRNHIERNLHVRCFYNLIGLHLWYTQLSAHDFMRYTPVYLKSNNTCQSKNKDMKSKELSADFRNRIVSRHRSGKRYKRFLQHWRSQWAQCPPSSINGRNLDSTGLFLELDTGQSEYLR